MAKSRPDTGPGADKIQIALLRGINVGGNNMIAMAALREMLGDLGFPGARTLLQSGNLVFESRRRTGAALEQHLERETTKRFQLTVDFVVRTAAEWRSAMECNPFPNEAANDPSHLVVVFLKAAPPAADVRALQAAIQGPETLRCDGRQLYIVYPAGMGTSKLTTALIERKLGIRGTARNWNTVRKLAALCEPSE